MEYDAEDQRLGGGIITLSVLHFITSAFSIIGGIFMLAAETSEDIQGVLQSYNLNLSTGSIIFQDIILRIILVISLILLLKKNKIGIYGYFLFAIIALICTIITSGFNILSIIMSLIFPVLMALFIYKKKEIFGFN